MKTRDAARGRWKGILTHFGMADNFLRNLHGPCPLCKGKDRFRWDDAEGDGTFYCNQCGSGTGLRLLMEFKTWTFETACKEIDRIINNIHAEEQKNEQTEEQKLAKIRALIKSGHHLAPGQPAWKYLESRCGSMAGAIIPDLKAHHGCKHSIDGRTFPALLAIMRYADGTGASVHRTYLSPDGKKAPVDPVRMIMPGKPINGSSVRLGPIQEQLGIAEGIETAICASKTFNLPVWAAISAGGMQAWEPPPGVTSVVIFGDNDENFVGQGAAFALAKKLRMAGMAVEVRIPDTPGTDWADVFMAGVA